MKARPLLLIPALLCLAAPAASAAEVSGRVELLARGGGGAARGADLRNAVVYFDPAGAHDVRPLSEHPEMATRDKAFVPAVLAVTRGSRVRFPNYDPILHNAFSVSGANRFDLGFFRQGQAGEWTFDTPGIVRVFCNVHHSMAGYILVLETPYYAAPDAGGRFTLKGVPPGPGTLTVWHPQTETWKERLTPGTGGAVVARLEVTQPLVPPHRNKHGRSYGRSRRYR